MLNVSQVKRDHRRGRRGVNRGLTSLYPQTLRTPPSGQKTTRDPGRSPLTPDYQGRNSMLSGPSSGSRRQMVETLGLTYRARENRGHRGNPSTRGWGGTWGCPTESRSSVRQTHEEGRGRRCPGRVNTRP